MKCGDLVRMRRFQPEYYGGDLFATWTFARNELPVCIGFFPIDSIGLVISISSGLGRRRSHVASRFNNKGAHVFVNGMSGWINIDDIELV